VATKKQTKDELKKALDTVDWAKIDALTDEQIEAAARSDPDNPPLTGDELARLRRPAPRSRRKPTAAE
jgi:hypothetical protein